jgi:lysozyme
VLWRGQPIGTQTRIALASLSISGAALVGMAVHEGYRGEAYHATEDERARGISTIGFGTTEGVRPGDRTTPERALVRLLEDATRFERHLKECIGDVPMFPHEWDAIVSWAYNVGPGAACGSTLVRKLKAGDYAGACRELLRWDKQSGRTLPGLTKRRQDEFRRCVGEAG